MTDKVLEVANWQEAQRPIAGTCEVISQQRITNSKPSTSPPLYSPFTSCSQIVSGGLPNRIGERQTSSFKPQRSTAVINLGSGILGQTARVGHFEDTRYRGMFCGVIL